MYISTCILIKHHTSRVSYIKLAKVYQATIGEVPWMVVNVALYHIERERRDHGGEELKIKEFWMEYQPMAPFINMDFKTLIST